MACPKIHVTKSGKRYFVVSGRKIYVTSDLTKKQITSIYKLLLKSVPKPRKDRYTNTNVINQYIGQEPRRRRRRAKPKQKPFVSTITDANRVTTSGSTRDPKHSGDKKK